MSDVQTNVTSEPNILGYYAARAREYESVYAKPERQNDLGVLHTVVPAFFRDRCVLEVACGTGYWTRRIASTATHVTACDLVPDVLTEAATNQPASEAVEYRVADAFQLADVPGEFDAGFAGFWWSHVLRQDLSRFLIGFHRRLPHGTIVLVVDNRYVAGSNWPIARSDDMGNTYQRRQLNDGSVHEVLKNFPSPSEVVAEISAAGGHDIVCRELRYYWYTTYVVGADF
jgi:SAM-dependent methyltransferase